MTFTNTQTKLGQAITTNASGDYAVRTIIEGDQTLENLTLTGDLNGGGGHILNEQTTTNMMSKGTVYRFDGVNDIVSMGTSSGIVDIFDNGGCVVSEIYPLSDGENNAGTIAQTRNSGGQGWNITLAAEAAGYVKITFVCEFSTTDGTWSTDVVLPLNTWSNVAVVYDSSSVANVPAIYFNGVPMTVGSVSTPDGTRVTDAGQVVSIGNRADTQTTFDGSIASVLFGNFAPTAAEVKDLISGNIPFKWQYGSQTESVTDGDFPNNTNWTEGVGWTIGAGVATHSGATGILTQVNADLAVSMVAGKQYRLTFTYSGNTGGGAVGWNNAGAFAGESFVSVTEESGTYSTVYTCRASNGNVSIYAAAAFDGSVDNASIVAIGAVALYDQTSISETTWYDKANGNDGAVTGASVLNPHGHAVDSAGAVPGVLFPATQVASSDVNMLDDYEEGAFTPTFFDAAAAGNEATYTTQEGTYTKIGRVVKFRLTLDIAGIAGMTGGNGGYIRGLPFAHQTVTGNYDTLLPCVAVSIAFGGQVYANIASAAAILTLRTMATGTSTTELTVANIGTGWLTVNGSYQV